MKQRLRQSVQAIGRPVRKDPAPFFLACMAFVAGFGIAVPVPAASAAPTETRIAADGAPADWAGYPVLLTDRAGDARGGDFDIDRVSAFTNDTFLYVLATSHRSAVNYVQIDLDLLTASGRRFVVSSPRSMGGILNLGEIVEGAFQSRGPIADSAFAATANAAEFKLPLAAIGGTHDLTLADVRPMNGQCCAARWYAVDQIDAAEVPRLAQSEAPVKPAAAVASEPKPAPQPATAHQPQPPRPTVCAAAAPAAAGGALPAAPVRFAVPGYKAAWFVAPSALNMPQQVLRTAAGGTLVLSIRSGTLFRLSAENRLTPFARDVTAYLGDRDGQGNIYLHGHPWGTITRISPTGAKTIVARSLELRADCDGGFGVGPDGNLYVVRSRCRDKADLMQVTPAGAIRRVAEVPQIQALRATADGRFLAATGDTVVELSVKDFSVRFVGRLPTRYGTSAGGLAVDDDGTIYVSTGGRGSGGEIFRLRPPGAATLMATIPDNGLSGIAWFPKSNTLVGGQLRRGAVIEVSTDGSQRELVSGNGLVSPMGMAVSPCGELAVANDDGGMMALVDASGVASWFMDYISFTPPIPYVAFARDGTMYASEGAPGLKPEGVAIVPPGGAKRTLRDAAMPSGLALRPDGTLLVSETTAGRITAIHPDGSAATLVDGLKYPQALALGLDGALYAIVGGRPGGGVSAPNGGDAVMRLAADGSMTKLTDIRDASALAAAADGSLFVAAPGAITRISPKGRASPFAGGFREARGLAFDLAGSLYVSDSAANGIVRISGFAQGTLAGTVRDKAGKPIAGARVQVLTDRPAVVGTVAASDASGGFSVAAAPNTYAVTVTATGHAPRSLARIAVTAGKTVTVEIELR